MNRRSFLKGVVAATAAGSCAPEPHVDLFDPSTAALQAALNQAAWVRVTGSYVADAPITLPGNRILEFIGDARISGHVRTPAPRDADDPDNCLFRASFVHALTVMNTTLAADCAEDDEEITVVDAGAVKPGTEIILEGGNNYLHSIDTPGDTQEFNRVIAREGNVLKLASPVRRYRGPRATVRAVAGRVGDVRVYGGVFDCSASLVASAFYLRGARDFTFEGQRARGFSRAFIDVEHGTRGVLVGDYRCDGAVNASVFAQSADDVTVQNWSFNPEGDYVHRLGEHRAMFHQQMTCTNTRIVSGRFGRHACAIQLWGGRHTVIGDIAVDDVDTSKRTRHVADEAWFGAALSTGCAAIGQFDEFFDDLTISSITASRVKTHASHHGIYLHDGMRATIGKIKLTNLHQSTNGRRYAGVCISDVVRGCTIDQLLCSGMTDYALRTENGGGGRIEIGYLDYSDATSDGFLAGADVIHLAGTDNFPNAIRRLTINEGRFLFRVVGSAFCNAGFAIEDLSHGSAGITLFKRSRPARLTNGIMTLGAALQVDPGNPAKIGGGDAAELWVRQPEPGPHPLASLMVGLLSIPSDHDTYAVVGEFVQYGQVLVRAADAVVPGDRLCHDELGRFKVDPDAEPGTFVTAMRPKRAGEEQLVEWRL